MGDRAVKKRLECRDGEMFQKRRVSQCATLWSGSDRRASGSRVGEELIDAAGGAHAAIMDARRLGSG